MSTFRNKGTAPPLPSRTVPSSVQNSVPELPQRPKRLPPRPPILESNHPVTSQPYPVPAVRRKKLPMLPDSESHSAEEELYEDTIVNENSEPVIPEYTEEQEAEDELYDDTDMQPPPLPSQPPPSRPRYAPPPPPPSGSIGLDNTLGEELYQDAMDQNPVEEDLYEEMPADTISNDEANGPMYSNRKEELRFKKEEEKQRRKEQKEKEKKDRELEKLRKKYLITGDELPVDTGVVKCDSRGGRLDLTVKKGEVLEILRMENNPSGKWLVRNDRAKIGYVELTNIQVDANSIKSVMVTRASMQNLAEELYNDAETEEALYEETF
ncbi:phosphatase and actin regulator 4B-like [Limulus polyphemus]|uniref:Phosphatase and actin regulator 4B-like n=1 Tax=Limulus polyphemus TaxID=6850 RepID=A0ABM1T783_LIMPO|nr:phosphatase and actin regulator 4B-like [Limulus polyphemus]